MKFIDHTIIKVKAGHGGAGRISFARAKHRPKLGPDGGDGGFGGDVIAKANPQFNTLSHIRYKNIFAAEDGEKGGTQAKNGKDGAPCIIEVPLGTIFYNKEDRSIVGEITKDNEELVLAKGGKRGLGNMRFTSSIKQAPYENTPGGEGEEFELEVELKLLADIGLAGFPNAGKSTLLSSISSAKPKIADYPFTTLTPNLGVVEHPNNYMPAFVVADIPGLLKDAHLGKGLGIQFLRHLERTKAIAFLIDIYDKTFEQVLEELEVLENELTKYSTLFLNKKFLYVFNKIEMLPSDSTITDQITNKIKAKYQSEPIFISAFAKIGLDHLKQRMVAILDEV